MMDDDMGLTQNTAQMNDILHWFSCYFCALVQIDATLLIFYLSWTHLHYAWCLVLFLLISAQNCGDLWMSNVNSLFRGLLLGI